MRSLSPVYAALFLALAFSANSPSLMGQETQASRQAPAAGEFIIKALRAEPEKASLYEIRFTTRDTLDSRAELILEFPAVFDLRALEVASSTNINGGFKLARQGNIVRVSRTGLGDPVLPGQTVDIKLGLVASPSNLAVPQDLACELRTASGKVQLDKKRFPIQYISQE